MTSGTLDFHRGSAQTASTHLRRIEMHALIETLDDASRELFDLLYYARLEQSVVAEMLGISTRSVKRRWHRARAALADRLRRAGYADRGTTCG